MTPNAKLDALIARIEGGEKLTEELDWDIALATGWVFLPKGDKSIGADRCWRDPSGVSQMTAIPPAFHKSFDAVMSLARNETEVEALLFAAMDCPLPPKELRTILDLGWYRRAMLIEALRARRT